MGHNPQPAIVYGPNSVFIMGRAEFLSDHFPLRLSHEVTPENSKGYFVTSVTHDSSDFSHVTGEGTGEAPDSRDAAK